MLFFSVRTGMKQMQMRLALIAGLVLATAKVFGVPVITRQPATVVDELGAVSSLSVEATGEGQLSYQWYQRSSLLDPQTGEPYRSAIVGETNVTYVPPRVPAAFLDTIVVEVKDSSGSVFSEGANVLFEQRMAVTNLLRWPEWVMGDARSAVIRSNLAYVAAGQIQVYDLSDPRNPVRVGWAIDDDSELGFKRNYINERHHLVMADSMLYAMSSFGSLLAYDLSDPTAPKLVGQEFGAGGSLTASLTFHVDGRYAYVPRSAYGIGIFDLGALPKIPLVATNQTDGYALMVEVKDDVAYVVTSKALEMVDVADKLRPRALGKYGTGGRALTIDGDRLYLLGDGLEVLDLREAGRPVRLGRNAAPPGEHTVRSRITVSAGLAYVSCGTNGVWVFDVKDPTAPRVITKFTNGGSASDLDVLGDTAYLANGEKGWQVLETRNLPELTVVETTDASGSFNEIFHRSNIVFAAAMSAGVQVLDVSTPERPEHLARFKTLAPAYSLALTDDTLYVASGDAGLEVLNVENPGAPQRIRRMLVGAGRAEEVLIAGGKLCVRVERVLHVFDINTRTNPVAQGTYVLSHLYHRMAAKDRYVLLSGWSEALNAPYRGTTQIIDVSGVPRSVGRIDDAGILPSIEENTLSLGGALYDLANLPQVRLLADQRGFGYGYWGQTYLKEGFMYGFGVAAMGFKVFDVSTPQQLSLVFSNFEIDGDRSMRQMVKVGDHFYAAAGGGGLMVLQRERGLPMITRQPGEKTTPFELNIWTGNVLEVKAAGDQPVRYQWYIGERGDTSKPIAGATNTSITVFARDDDVQATNGRVGKRWVRVTNQLGSTDSQTGSVHFRPRLRGRDGLIEWDSPGGRWVVQQSDDLRNWVTISPSPIDTVVEQGYRFDVAIGGGARFFRLLQVEE